MRARNCMGALAVSALLLGVSAYAAPRDGAVVGKSQARTDTLRQVTGTDAVLREAASSGVVATGCVTGDVVPVNATGASNPCSIVSSAGNSATLAGSNCDIDVRVFYSNFLCTGDAMTTAQAQIGPGLPAGLSIPTECSGNGDCAFQEAITPTLIGDLPACNQPNLACGSAQVNSPAIADDGSIFYLMTARLHVDAGFTGSVSITLQNPGTDSFLIGESGNTFTIGKVNDGVINVPTGRCCDPVACTEGGTLAECVAANLWEENGICPANGGPPCAECPNQTDAECNDGDACTVDTCNTTTLLCSHVETPAIGADECCNPADNSRTFFDTDPCTDDFCDAGGNRGVADSNPAADGSSCDDGNSCTAADQCTGGLCSGHDVNGDACPTGDCTNNGDTPGATCNATTGLCECSNCFPFVCTTSQECVALTQLADAVCNNTPCIGDGDCQGIGTGVCDTAVGFCVDAGSCCTAAKLTFQVDPSDKIDPNCFSVGQKVTVAVHKGSTFLNVTGGEFLINYDPSCLSFNSIVTTTDYPLELQRNIDEAAGTIFFAVGAPLGVDTGTNGSADMAVISFTKLDGCTACNLCFDNANPLHTRLVDAVGQTMPVMAQCSKNIRQSPLVTVSGPDSMKVNVACNSATREVTWSPVTVTSNCETDVLSCNVRHVESGLNAAQLGVSAITGGVLPVGNTNFCCGAVNSCGNSDQHCWTVTVNDQTCLDVQIQLSPTMVTKPGGGINRCIKFEVFSNSVQPPLVFENDMLFGGLFNLIGHFNGLIKIPSQVQPFCLTARDQLHTLRGCYVFQPGDCRADGCLQATFKGDPFFGGNWLVGGNLDGWKKDNPAASHDVIDILDFGQLVSQWLVDYGTGDTPCGTAGPNADINGDGVVDLLDFSFVSLNFLKDSKACCDGSGASLGNTTGRTSITVNELIRSGMKDLTVADLNADGVVDLADIQAFVQDGARPQRQAPARTGKGASLRSFNR